MLNTLQILGSTSFKSVWPMLLQERDGWYDMPALAKSHFGSLKKVPQSKKLSMLVLFRGIGGSPGVSVISSTQPKLYNPCVDFTAYGSTITDVRIVPTYREPSFIRDSVAVYVNDPWLYEMLKLCSGILEPLFPADKSNKESPRARFYDELATWNDMVTFQIYPATESGYYRNRLKEFFPIEDQQFRWASASLWPIWENEKKIWKERASDLDSRGFRSVPRHTESAEPDIGARAMIRRLQRFAKSVGLEYLSG